MKLPLFCLALLTASPVWAKLVSHEARLDVVRRAQLRQNVDPSTMDLLNGPQGEGAYKLGEAVPCKYEEKDPLHPLGGHSPKFPCVDKNGVRLKIKYKGDVNPEVYGEVAGARLLWALGFYAERMYSVKAVCENCPEDPWTSTKESPRATRTFEPVSIQKRLKGTEVSENEGEGWTFDELDLVNDSKGGATRAEADALKLLAVFMNHGDNTPNQQALVCLDGDAGCEKPVMYITDIGGVFGGKGYFASYRHWTRKATIWKDPAKCVADFKGTDPHFKDPKISEAGRKLLADLLGKLSDKQVKDLFLGARFDDLSKRQPPYVGPDGKSRPLTVDDWVKAFVEKRRQILSAHCPG
ncbi:hypothetical protein EPO15_01865 [bacterium]|nr:MAG: hypothetical protein EPO15_01865 [bacterium]